ncbi:unnamed protein product [Onchocerca flexuosa]|uniref:CBF domain-containing protein n=1 Tax=Onchocerca flexuosa TaxID=387005 RepID=A0A183H3W6_9BILA|nr:unnamed protein product [Onchocerca flexuosa]
MVSKNLLCMLRELTLGPSLQGQPGIPDRITLSLLDDVACAFALTNHLILHFPFFLNASLISTMFLNFHAIFHAGYCHSLSVVTLEVAIRYLNSQKKKKNHPMMTTTQQMSKKRKAVQDGIFKAELNNFLMKELAEDGYSGVEVRRTPARAEVALFVIFYIIIFFESCI